MRNRNKLETAAKMLTDIAEKHLSALSEEEQNARVSAFSRVVFNRPRGTRAKPSSTAQTPAYPVTARARK
jgi:hypothetical protein